LDFDAKEVEPGLYKIALTHQLKAGQYAFYLLSGFEHSSVEKGNGFVYCFQVECKARSHDAVKTCANAAPEVR
jgi:hypothetical protein